MQIFYASEITEGKALFNRTESIHCLRVLRLRKGDTIYFSDGKGSLYQGLIVSDNTDSMEASVTSVTEGFGRRNYRLHIAISPLKNNERLEWFIEKAVEMGIDEITPLICSRSEKASVRRERLEGIIVSAAKQSVKTYLTVLNEPCGMSDFVKGRTENIKLIAHCDSGTDRRPISGVIEKGDDVLVIIGPEGDFTTDEISAALNAGFIPVHLGTSRLRTETAGVAACCSVYLKNM